MDNNLITPPKYLPDMVITMGIGDSEKSGRVEGYA